MTKLTNVLVLGVFATSCLLARTMLTLILEVRNAGRELPLFTNLCISLRPVLIILPIAAAGYCLWLWLRNGENVSRWMGFVMATMTLLILFVLPAIGTSYLLMIDQVRAAVGAN
jgi:hypothetical protein